MQIFIKNKNVSTYNKLWSIISSVYQINVAFYLKTHFFVIYSVILIYVD